MSKDKGHKWSILRELDPNHPVAYSALLKQNGTHVGIAYERDEVERGETEIRFGFARLD